MKQMEEPIESRHEPIERNRVINEASERLLGIWEDSGAPDPIRRAQEAVRLLESLEDRASGSPGAK